MDKNTSKYLSYKEAWERINKALESESYFEAVTICESIISDRLLSYIQGVAPDSKLNTQASFYKLITEWKRLSDNLPDFEGKNLADATDAWRIQRNKIVHGLVKSDPGTPTEDVDTFIKRASEAAKAGAKLARAISDWHRKQLKDSNK